MNHISEEELILLHYEESDAAEMAREHLRGCAECTAAAEALERTFALCDAVVVPEPAEGLESRVWRGIEAEIWPARQGWSGWKWLAVPATAVAAAVMVLVAVRPAARPKALPDAARHRILAISLADHLDRSQMLLIELSNTEGTDAAELEMLQTRARDLLDEGRLLRQWIPAGEAPTTLALVEQVERVLAETANTQGRPEELRALREQIGDDSLVFKVRIVEANLRTEGQKS
jgi:hypothetical protein